MFIIIIFIGKLAAIFVCFVYVMSETQSHATNILQTIAVTKQEKSYCEYTLNISENQKLKPKHS